MTREEAIKIIRDWNLGHAAIEVLSTFIPELKENEDERMIKFISNELACLRAVDGKGSDRYKELTNAIAWLEKQGEQDEECKEINLVEILKHYPKETELFSPLYGKLWLAEVDEKNEIITCYKHHLEKGCTRAVLEQEDSVSFYSNGTTGLPDFSISKDCMLFLYDKEKQGEQKLTDKVEPKFKVGDWLVTPDNKVKQIEKVTFGNYWFTDESLYNITDVDNKGHLWTIQDAKDGDILVTQYDKPFIYNGNRNSSHIGAYCGVDVENGFYVATKKCYWSENTDIYPVTKEQRDLLFSKMKEDGYEWDAENKVLKKIGQKPAWGKDDEGFFNLLLAIFTNEHQNSVFSTDNIPVFNGNYVHSNRIIAWLKSLKERIQSQPTK